jgi:uncharacterized protein
MNDIFNALKVPGPLPTQISEPFWHALREGGFVLQHCDACGKALFYPRAHCPHCWSERLTWREASGRGTVKSFSVIHRPGHFAWAAVAPYVIVLIDLDEGPTMLSQLIVDDPADARVGLRVTLRPVAIGEYTLPFFKPSTDNHEDTR